MLRAPPARVIVSRSVFALGMIVTFVRFLVGCRGCIAWRTTACEAEKRNYSQYRSVGSQDVQKIHSYSPIRNYSNGYGFF